MATFKGLITFWAWGGSSGATHNIDVSGLNLAPGDTLLALTRRTVWDPAPSMPAGWENLLDPDNAAADLPFPDPDYVFSPYGWVNGAHPSTVSITQDAYDSVLFQFVALTLEPGEIIGSSWPLGMRKSVDMNDPVQLAGPLPTDGDLYVIVSREAYGIM